MKEHFDDEFVKRSQKEGYRSRAVYKLQEIDDKDRLLKPGVTVVDLGAAPGGWSQYVARKYKDKVRIIASDILPIEPLEHVEFLQGDFTELEVMQQLMAMLGDERPALVMSDMAPNMSGMDVVDIPRTLYMAELALHLAQQVLQPGGNFLVKMFQGEGFDMYLKDLRTQFTRVVQRKPKASRSRSREVYVVAMGYKGT